jgi:hypothetical protein
MSVSIELNEFSIKLFVCLLRRAARHHPQPVGTARGRFFAVQKLDGSFRFAFECCLEATFELSNVLTHPLRTIIQPIKSESEIALKIFQRFLLSGSDDEERRSATTKSGEHSRYKSNGENAAESKLSKYEI